MNCVLLILHGTLLLHSVVTFPPAPVKVYVDSHNFYHVLRWDPGPGTPPGTLYYITQRKENEEKEELLTSNTTWLDLLLDDNDLEYSLTVEAFYNQTRSKESKTIFYPYRDTHIDPAEVSLSGCGNCIHVNISMPEPYWRSGIDDLYYYYFPKFTIYWRKAAENPEKEICLETDDKSYTLRNLEMGREYCVKVDTKIRTNLNTKASAWKCAFTSPVVESRTDSPALGVGSALMIVLVGALMISLSCLYYAGFLGKLQATVPRALIVALRQGYTLTPETTRTYLISVTSEIGKQRMHSNPTVSHAATSDANSEERSEDEEEEENEMYDYLDRDAELSTDESACSRTSVSGHCKPAASGNSSSSQVEEPPAELDSGLVQGGLDQDDCKAEGATVSFTSEEGQSKVQGRITVEQEDCKVNAYDSSGNVNLFSVTIAALLVDVEEEQDTRDTLTARDSNITLNNADTQMTDSDNQLTVASACPTQKDFTKTGYEGRHAHTEEEEEEEEESSEYMRHV